MSGANDSPVRLSDHERFFFDVNGYVVRTGVLDPATAEVLNRGVDEHWPAPPGESLASQRFHGFLGWPGATGEAFQSLLDHPDAIGVALDLIGDQFRLDHCYGIQMRHGTSGLDIHGGGSPHDPSQYYRHVEGQMVNGLIGVAWGLSQSGPGDGGFCCIPGSHHASEPVPDDVATFEAHPEWVREVPLPPGSMLVFTEALAHGTLPWKGKHERRALFYKYAPGYLAWAPALGWDERLFGPTDANRIPVDVAAGMTARRRDLLRPPSVPYRRSFEKSRG